MFGATLKICYATEKLIRTKLLILSLSDWGCPWSTFLLCFELSVLIRRMSIDLINSDFVMYEESGAVGEIKQVNRKTLSSHVISIFVGCTLLSIESSSNNVIVIK